MKKTIGWVLLILGVLALLGGMTSKVDIDPIVKLFAYILKFAMIIIGGYLAFSVKKNSGHYHEIEKLNPNTPSNNLKTLKDFLPQYSKIFIQDNEIKNDINESIFTQKGILDFNIVEGIYEFILTREASEVKLTCIFNDNKTIPVSKNLVVGSFADSQKFSTLQWIKIIESLKSEIDTSYLEMRTFNTEKHFEEALFATKILDAQNQLKKKSEEFQAVTTENKTILDNRMIYLKEVQERANNGDSSIDVNKLKEEDDQIAIKLDSNDLRRNQLNNEIKVLMDFLKSDKVREFVSKKSDLGKYSNVPVEKNKNSS